MNVELKENIKFTTSNIPFAPRYATQKSAMAVSFATCIAQMA